jgi:hypothetical protein
VFRLGGDGDLSFAKPLKKAPKGLPPGAAEVFTKISGHIKMSWQFDDEIELPDAFEECMYGDLDLHPKCFDTVTKKWSTSDDPVWRDKVVFAPDGSGDYLGLDASGRILFLSHDLCEPHGMVLADSLTDLIERWAPLGFVGPDGVALTPFMRKKRLDPECPAAKRFLTFVGGKSRDWKRAKKRKLDAFRKEPKGFDVLVRGMTDPSLDTPWGPYRAQVLELIPKWYGRGPSPALHMLLAHIPGKDVRAYKPAVPGGMHVSWVSAFVHACADVHLLAGALTNTWPIGSNFLVEVSPSADQVSARRPLLGFDGVSTSLDDFAPLVLSKEEKPAKAVATRAVALAKQAKMLRALLEHDDAHRHLTRLSPTPLPDDFATLDCASALRALLTCFLSGAPLAKVEHDAALVTDAYSLLITLNGPDPRNPANFLWLAREVCTGKRPGPVEHDDPDQLVNKAYEMQKEARWSEMLAIADDMIARGFRLDHAWPYRVRALAGLSRHEDVLVAADTALLFCSIGSSELFGAKLTALAALGETEASEAHLWWCSPHHRTVTLKR